MLQDLSLGDVSGESSGISQYHTYYTIIIRDGGKECHGTILGAPAQPSATAPARGVPPCDPIVSPFPGSGDVLEFHHAGRPVPALFSCHGPAFPLARGLTPNHTTNPKRGPAGTSFVSACRAPTWAQHPGGTSDVPARARCAVGTMLSLQGVAQ